jgi:prophage antirepressor-like protein
MLHLLDSPSEFKKAVTEAILDEVRKKLVVRNGKKMLKPQYSAAQKKKHTKNQFKNSGGLSGAKKSKKVAARKLKKTNRAKGSQIQRQRKKSLARGNH